MKSKDAVDLKKVYDQFVNQRDCSEPKKCIKRKLLNHCFELSLFNLFSLLF